MARLAPRLAAALAFAILAAPALSVGAGGAHAPSTQCRQGETVAYSCRYGPKIASVCATATGIAYRFGPPGRPEIEIASNGRDGLTHQGFVVGNGHGRGDYLRFSSGETNFVIHSAVTGELSDKPGSTWSGVTVLRDHTEVSSRDCPQKGRDQRLATPAFVAEEPDDSFDQWY